MSRPLALSQAENHVWTSLYADYVTEVSVNKDKVIHIFIHQVLKNGGYSHHLFIELTTFFRCSE
jgi:hypothetical protein